MGAATVGLLLDNVQAVLRAVATLRRKRLIVTWHEVWGPEYWRDYLGALGRVGWWLSGPP